MLSVWLDTDIGDDTDDILALSLICASPELELAGVSTVLGETAERARLARTLLASTSGPKARVKVAAGSGSPLPGKVTPHFWPNLPVERPWMAQLPCALPAALLPTAPKEHGVELLANHLRRHPGKTIPIGIGPMTNLATLLLREPKLIKTIPRMVLMAGEFKRPMCEWNVRCDPLASACLIESGIPIDFIPWDIGMKCTVSTAQLKRLFAGRSSTNRLLSRAIRLWQKAKSRPHRIERPHLFDPMAVSVLLHPEWFTWRRGRVTVSFAPQTFGFTQFKPDPRGPHRVAWSVRAETAVASVWSRIVSL